MQQSFVPGFATSVVKHYKFMTLTMALLSVGMVSGCASTPPQKTQASVTKTVGSKSAKLNKKNKQGSTSAALDENSIDSLEDLLSASDMGAVEDNKLAIMRYGDVWRRIRSGFKMNLDVSNPRIDAQRSWFASRQPYIDRLSARASRYLYHTVTEAERRGIPTELALLPVIESSYDPSATSSATAAGLWQFIPSTGTIYGLRQSSLYDGRRDVVESTRAAYDFLTNLYNQFGSWELALAAYNAGPGRIQQAINRNIAAGLPTDYWSLRLPAETMNYVPRFLAVAQIVKQPEYYGLTLPSIANRPHFRSVQLPGVVDLNMAASIAGLSLRELYELNSGFRSGYTDPMGPSRLLIPASLDLRVDDNLRKMPTLAQTNPALLASLGPVGGAVVLSGGNSSYNTQQAAALMSAGSRPATSISSGAVTTVTKTTPAATANTGLIASVVKRMQTPSSATALAAFANQAEVPATSSPRIPVAVTPAANVKPISEPPVSAAELNTIKATDSSLQQPETPVITASAATPLKEPEPTPKEKQQVVEELKALAPEGTQVVDPLDGKIQLTAIQTSQSVADAKGEELSIKYEQPEIIAQKNTAAIAKTKKVPPVVTAAVAPKPENKPKGERTVYIVQPGDTLALIASRHNLNWREVADWNQIDPNKPLYKGASLYLYGAKKVEQAKPTSYTVQAGDTLTAVAERFGMTARQLADMNDMKPTSNLIRGAHLSLVEGKASRSNSDDSAEKVALTTYKVKRGEYLKQIAERFDMTNEALAEMNNLKPTSELAIGQTLKVPASKAKANDDNASDERVSARRGSKADTTTYTVKSGDSLRKIANKFDSSNEDLAKLNKISPNAMLTMGQKLIVPNGDTESEAPEKPTSYRVQSGDTLSAVADKFDMSPKELAELNDMKPSSNLIKGTTLTLVAADSKAKKSRNDSRNDDKRATSKDDDVEAVRVSARASGTGTEEYSVKRGESLNAIAAKYDMSAAELARLNNISAKSGLQNGQTINVPKLTTNYKVKRGDTLHRLADKFGISIKELAAMNQISPKSSIQLGDVLVVPNNNNRSL